MKEKDFYTIVLGKLRNLVDVVHTRNDDDAWGEFKEKIDDEIQTILYENKNDLYLDYNDCSEIMSELSDIESDLIDDSLDYPQRYDSLTVVNNSLKKQFEYWHKKAVMYKYANDEEGGTFRVEAEDYCDLIDCILGVESVEAN